MSRPERPPDNRSSKASEPWNGIPLQAQTIRDYMQETQDVVDQVNCYVSVVFTGNIPNFQAWRDKFPPRDAMA